MEDQVFYLWGDQFAMNIDSLILDIITIIAIVLAGVFIFQIMWIMFYWIHRQISNRHIS